MPLKPIESQILTVLQAGRALTVRWDCGGDESFVYTEVDGAEQPFDFQNQTTDFAFGMDRYLTDLLELPSAGEFEMRGTGRIFQEGAAVVIDYQSEAFADDSWMADLSDEQLEEMGYTRPAPPDPAAADDVSYPPDPSMSDEYSGRRVLFQVS